MRSRARPLRPWCGSSVRLRERAETEVAGERARGAPAVADRVLLGGAELGHRPAIVGAGVGGDERGVVAEAARAPRLGRELPLAATVEDALGAGAIDVGHRTDVGDLPIL